MIQQNAGSDPIDVTVVGSTATIGIGSTSNAYGRKYVQTAEPTTDVCDGDIWYDLTGTTGDISLGVGINSGGTVIGTGITTLNFVGTGTTVALLGTTASISTGSGSSGFSVGMIMMFSGATIPSGWALCDGNNNTPDLRNKFIVAS